MASAAIFVAAAAAVTLALRRRGSASRAAPAPAEDADDARHADELLELLRASGLPAQSRFRVAALITYVSSAGRVERALGINVESTVIGAGAGGRAR